ncbi:AAA domain-containing protein [Streptohalobacillus salinus]|uniref:AAA domain-containing protein n=1 Tax=Streptohalobacillus salinus TaxID=621096 RepID=A0A2V3WEA0_9BACI|nr:AAA family ATPase [Streptohalobacillus salinus]PXW91431.1 AAA domain-containing protein [Streptohalobacillus salinus]
MTCVIITGPQAVGKMTVGQSLAELTDLQLFHNHMTIDLVSHFFNYDEPAAKRLVDLFREEIFREVARCKEKGLIFTYVWAFNEPDDWAFIENLKSIFHNADKEVYIVELEADVTERLKRNASENRLLHKPSKRDTTWSKSELISSMENYRLNSLDGEISDENYLKINNETLTAAEVARKIVSHFNLSERDK